MRIPAIKVNQWLDDWNNFEFREDERQRRPPEYFYVASVDISILRRLSNVPRRGEEATGGRQEARGSRIEDIGMQRGFEENRAAEIREFVRGGYPWATIRKTLQDQHPGLKKPGWLPTAIVVNIVRSTTQRKAVMPVQEDLIKIEDKGNGLVELLLPDNIESSSWKPQSAIYPLEVIDGQHRLLAFEPDEKINGHFDIPVVMFDDIDISWQAYLFWTINVSPKRISPSLGYDLYPLLRTQDWLDSDLIGPLAYREARAQVLTEALWSQPESPWLERISMLGREQGKVTQAAFVRSLTLSYIRGESSGNRAGGLFGARIGETSLDILGWSRAQQAAYLILMWSELEQAIKETEASWVRPVREQKRYPEDIGEKDPAFAGRFSLLATDQGVRGFLQVSNDISYFSAEQLSLNEWKRDKKSEATDPEEVSEALTDLRSRTDILQFMKELCQESAKFNWSSSVTPNLSDAIRNQQALYRTGSGYREVRRQLLLHLKKSEISSLRAVATVIVQALKY